MMYVLRTNLLFFCPIVVGICFTKRGHRDHGVSFNVGSFSAYFYGILRLHYGLFWRSKAMVAFLLLYKLLSCTLAHFFR
jgi:hypothetical protein